MSADHRPTADELLNAPSPQASIVINNFNYGRYLGRCVESCLNQTVCAEIIVVDDGSTDGSLETLASYGEQVRVIAQRNGGQGEAINSGIRAAQCRNVILLDSDDWMYPTRVQRVIDAMPDGPGWVRHALRIHDDVTGPGTASSDAARVSTPREDLDSVGHTGGATSALAFNAELLELIGLIPSEIYRSYADSYLMMCGAYLGTCVTIGDALGARFLHRSQLTVDPTRSRITERIMLRAHLAETAATLSRSEDVHHMRSWWQRKAMLHRVCVEGGLRHRPAALWRYCSSLWRADLELVRKCAFLARDTLLVATPNRWFPRMWWLTSDGRRVFKHPAW